MAIEVYSLMGPVTASTTQEQITADAVEVAQRHLKLFSQGSYFATDGSAGFIDYTIYQDPAASAEQGRATLAIIDAGLKDAERHLKNTYTGADISVKSPMSFHARIHFNWSKVASLTRPQALSVGHPSVVSARAVESKSA